jgi:hypothetical protein
MPIGFPASPTLNQEWPTESPRWRWDGAKWVSTGGAVPITARLSTVVGTDDVIALRASVPYLASLAAVAAYTGGSPAATEPAAFTAGQWTAAATSTPGEISFNLTALPADGGSAITALQYRVGTGAAIAFSGTGTGVRVVTAGLTPGVAVDLQVRAVNAVGAGAWSDVKNRTPLAGGGSISYVGAGAVYRQYSAQTTHVVAVPAGLALGDMLVVACSEFALPTGLQTNTGQTLTSAISNQGSIWRVLITGSVPTSVTITLGTATEYSARAFGLRGVTQLAGTPGTTDRDIIAAPRNDFEYSTDSASAAVVVVYLGGTGDSSTARRVTAATFPTGNAASNLTKFDFDRTGVVVGLHTSGTGLQNAAATWSETDTGGRYITAAFKA